MQNSDYKRKCNKCGTQMKKEYNTDYHDIFQCPNCEYQKAIKIEECCRNSFKIVIVDNTMKVNRLLYQCKNCGGIVNRSKPLSFKEFSDEIRDEINIYAYEEWKLKIDDESKSLNNLLWESNRSLTNFGKMEVHYVSKQYRALRKTALIRDNYKCQRCQNKAEEMHHLTYNNFPNEKLEDLQSLCSKCHTEITHLERQSRIKKK